MEIILTEKNDLFSLNTFFHKLTRQHIYTLLHKNKQDRNGSILFIYSSSPSRNNFGHFMLAFLSL